MGNSSHSDLNLGGMAMLNQAVINQVAMLFLIMGIGVIAKKKKNIKR